MGNSSSTEKNKNKRNSMGISKDKKNSISKVESEKTEVSPKETTNDNVIRNNEDLNNKSSEKIQPKEESNLEYDSVAKNNLPDENSIVANVEIKKNELEKKSIDVGTQENTNTDKTTISSNEVLMSEEIKQEGSPAKNLNVVSESNDDCKKDDLQDSEAFEQKTDVHEETIEKSNEKDSMNTEEVKNIDSGFEKPGDEKIEENIESPKKDENVESNDRGDPNNTMNTEIEISSKENNQEGDNHLKVKAEIKIEDVDSNKNLSFTGLSDKELECGKKIMCGSDFEDESCDESKQQKLEDVDAHDISDAIAKTSIYEIKFSNENDEQLASKIVETIRIFCGTWNLSNSIPPENLETWIKDSCDIYAFGVQNLAQPIQENNVKDWQTILENSLGQEYVKVDLEKDVSKDVESSDKNLENEKTEDEKKIEKNEPVITIFVKKDKKKFITEVNLIKKIEDSNSSVSLHHVTAVSLKYQDTRMIFVTCDLFDEKNLDERNMKIRKLNFELFNSCVQLNEKNEIENIHAVPYCFWFGSLYYDLDCELDIIKKNIEENNIENLLSFDQLKKAQENNHALSSFEEAKISFKPTFSLQRTSEMDFDYENNHPSYCDRVLVQTLEGYSSKTIEYNIASDISTSNHKPLYYICDIEVRNLFSSKPCLESSEKANIKIGNLKLKELQILEPQNSSEHLGHEQKLFITASMNSDKDFIKVSTNDIAKSLNSEGESTTFFWEEELKLLTTSFNQQNLEFFNLMFYVHNSSDLKQIVGETCFPLSLCFDSSSKNWHSAEFNLRLSRHGLFCGTLSGEVTVLWN